MSWQEELRKLDEELAAGQISADDYRVRRDQVLSSAVSSGGEGQQATNEATQFVAPVQPTPPGQPESPTPPGQQPPRGDSGDADRTQIVPGDADRTQAVGGWQTARPTGPDADRTQVVPGVPPQSYAAGGPPRPAPGQGAFPPPPGQHGWTGGEEPGPPWAGADFPPLAATGSPDWIRQGPEVFEESSGSNKGKIAAIIAGVLVVALIGVGIWWFATKDDSGGTNQTGGGPTTTEVKKTTTTPSGPPRPLDGVQGQVDKANSGPITVAQAAEKHQFSPDEASILGECAARDGQVEVLYSEKWYTLVHVFKCADRGARDDTVTKLLKQQEAYGFKEFSAPKSLRGMIIENATDVPDAPVDARVFYASGDNIIRVEVRGRTLADADNGLSQVITATTKNFAVK